MKKVLFFIVLLFVIVHGNNAQNKLDELLPVRGFSISAPAKDGLDDFIKFINEELIPLRVNTLVLRIGYRYQYKSHPELSSENALSKGDVKKIVKACKAGNIRIIPLVNLLGHQSGRTRLGNLLREYPEFDETPHVQMNDEGLYAKSYCPLHPEVHDVVFDVVDEIVDAFDTDAFHAGMDEVFLLGDDKCPRCSGRDKAELFAGEVTKIRNHLAENGIELWIWSDRLLDGKTTGVGLWEGSYNNTHRAIDMIPKDVVMCDWHYERADPTAVIFALKGFRVITCPWNKAQHATVQMHQMVNFRQNATKETKENFMGMMQTTWTGAGRFINGYYGKEDLTDRRGNQVECFKVLYEEINKLDK